MEKKSLKISKSTTKELNNQESITSLQTTKMDYKTLIVQGEKYTTTYTRKYENRQSWHRPDPKHVLSYIPGTIEEVFVKEGSRVKKGDKLLLLEAMKMMNIIEVPMDGKVGKIYVKPGDKIPKGFLMVEFE